MALHYTCTDDVIEKAVRKMIRSGKVAPDARFNIAASDGLRTEVSYRDMDFLEFLPYCDEEKIVNTALQFLVSHHLVPENSTYDPARFLQLRKEVKQVFKGSWGTITPALERLLYMFTSVRKPRNMAAIGVFWGNAFIWNAGSSCGQGKVYNAERIIGVDINPKAVEMATANIAALSHAEHISIVLRDGCEFVKEVPGTFDYLYLDVGISAIEKSFNYDMVRDIYDKLEPGAWVVTHDTTHPYFRQSFSKYLAFVRDKQHFSESISFDFDPYGLEVSIK